VLGIGEDALSIYLNDHLAGATLGVNLARRVARHDPPQLGPLADEIEQDRGTLLEVMERLSVAQDPVKTSMSWALEQASRLKFKERLAGDAALTRFEEIEALSLGVEGKLALWTALARTHAGDPRLRTIDFDALAERARSQRRVLEEQRARAADLALA
jgi:hypothetical protein